MFVRLFNWLTLYRLLVIIGLVSSISSVHAADMITSSGLGTTITMSGNNYTISDGTTVSDNLFYSFGIFNIDAGKTADFTGANTINNIISRVTGGTASSINGTLRSSIAGANVYLLNPAGVMFGADASLSVSGSFYVSTADYLELADGGRFDATTPNNSVLSTAAPSAFGFLAQPAGISFQGSRLSVPKGKHFGIIGGDITITQGQISIAKNPANPAAGSIQIASVASSGKVMLTAGSGLTLADVSKRGSITISGLPANCVVPEPMACYSLDANGYVGTGEIVIRAGDLTLTGTGVGADTFVAGPGAGVNIDLSGKLEITGGGKVSSSTFGAGNGGDIAVSADQVILTGTDAMDSRGGLFAASLGAGNSGNIAVQAGRIEVTGGSIVGAATYGPGNAGDISVAADTIILAGTNRAGDFAAGLLVNTNGAGAAGILRVVATDIMVKDNAMMTSTTFASGKGGLVDVRAQKLHVADGGLLASVALNDGAAGNMHINASDIRLTTAGTLYSASAGAGNAGDVQVSADTLTMETGGRIEASTVVSGRGGSILVDVSDAINISGRAPASSVGSYYDFRDGITDGALTSAGVMKNEVIGNSGLRASSLGQALGNAGSINITAGRLQISNNGDVRTDSKGSGRAGNIVIATQHDTIITHGSIASQTLDGAGGSISLTAEKLVMDDQALISGTSTGAGVAGTILVDARDTIRLYNGSKITSDSVKSGGGGITVNAINMLHLKDSFITTSVNGGGGDAGNISIDPIFVIMEGSIISANAFEGQGGSITIRAQHFIADPDSIVEASSQLGITGSIQISSPDTDTGGFINVLPQVFFDASQFLSNACTNSVRQHGSGLSVRNAGFYSETISTGETLRETLSQSQEQQFKEDVIVDLSTPAKNSRIGAACS